MLGALRRGVYAFSIALAAVQSFGAAPKFKDPVIAFEWKFKTAFSFKLRDLLTDPAIPGPLTWTIKDQPSWLKLDTVQETLTGTPTTAGAHNFTMGVASGDGGDANHRAVFNVLAPPVWSDADIDLGVQNEGSEWSYDLTKAVANQAGGAITITATGLPEWMRQEGNFLKGKPARKHVGNYTGIQLSAVGVGGTGSATAHGTVRKVIQRPSWTANEITLPDAFEDQNYSESIKQYVVNPDPEASAPRYFIASATPPPWLQLGKDSGTLFGTPAKENVKLNEVSVRMEVDIDGVVYDATTLFKIKVIHVNHSPKWKANPITLPDAWTGIAFQADLAKSVDDSDGDKLTFTLLQATGPGAAWAKIDPATGKMTGTPLKANVGAWSFEVEAKDPSGAKDTSTIQVNIRKSNEAPYWTKKPLVLPNAKEDERYQIDLSQAQYAVDPDGDRLKFEKLDGPSWITISPEGILTGKPGKSDVKLHSFSVKVEDGIAGQDITTIQILVEHTNHAPEWVINPIIFSVQEDENVQVDISGYARDVDGDKLTFSSIGARGPSWGSVDAKGIFKGTPRFANVGKNVFVVRVADNTGATADAELQVTVIHVNHKPFWAQPVTLPNAKEDVAYNESVTSFAKDPDGDPLTITKVSGPNWLTVNRDGTLGGTPSRADVGTFPVTLRVTDPSNLWADVKTAITVERVNKAPRWRQSPIVLGDFLEDISVSLKLTDFAMDPDGDPLKYELMSYSGPGNNWVFVGENGDMTGVPIKGNIGKFTVVFRVKDPGGLFADVTATGEVIHRNHPPTINEECPNFIVNEDSTFKASLVKCVTDTDGDPIQFTLIDTPSWVTLSAAGDMVATPKYPQVQPKAHAFAFKVDDKQVAIYSTIHIKVLRVPSPPVWLLDPIQLEAKTNVAFQGSVASYAKELDGIPLTFKKSSGTSNWLQIDSSGNLTGTPMSTDLGTNTFTVSACNDLLCSDAKLIITVVPGMEIETVDLSTPVPGAKAELLWVVDNTQCMNCLIYNFKKNINVFFEGIKGIVHSGIYISSDTYHYKGDPIHEKYQDMLMTQNTPNLPVDFNKRVDLASVSDPCAKSSPLFSMFRFYEKVPAISEIYHNGYMAAKAPMDVLIVTEQRDNYPWYVQNIPQLKNYTPANFARDFIAFHRNENKPYRVNAIAKPAPYLTDETCGFASTAAPDTAFSTVVSQTKGKYYATDNGFDMVATLRDYATRVKFRANMNAKERIALSKIPLDPRSITVSIGGVQLPGNQNTATDQWRYDSSRNEIILYWSNIDQSGIQPGATLEIKYRVT